ncbi:diaminopimelate decarboxylase [Rhizomicrobium electricum]|uniref:Diaminopimelate decarboxylase n=1 Tax=Rhizomicrobium electricum TaxID=480070 RepID=A0ABP3Q7L5_9PROT|nr:diaminopimelate decarboxylase [Rhizomicrobium electricum]NIJ49391.1 diaminopimelate decarboxylase [Rhizomicrobium electricum]
MNHFDYKNGELHAEDVALSAIAAEIGTPFYCYSTATLERHYRVFSEAMQKDALVAFSVKANGNLAVLKTLASLGAGADVVSGGELKRALAAGIPGEKIVFSGVGKTKAEMALGLKNRIYQFNVESEVELLALDEVAGALGVKAPVAFRVNPDVDAKTHAKISTGGAETKFGVPWSHVHTAYATAAKLKNIEIVGVDVHIGSQLTDLAPFEAAFTRVVELVGDLRREGHAISRIDLGGGLGVPYRNDNLPPPDPAAYGALAARITKNTGARLIMEPGRLIAANAGVLVAGVIYVKQGENKKFLILDAAMNDLIRPAFYDAYHEIVPVAAPTADTQWTHYDVVGPVCETSDIFAADRPLPVLKSDDKVAILTAGAYGATMSSAYNARPLAAEVLVKGGEWAVVRPRMDDDALFGNDRIPPWLG